MIKVLLVDDHEIVRSGVEALLNQQPVIDVVGVCSTGEEALVMIAKTAPDVIFMDVRMPGLGGVETCRRMLQMNGDMRVIGLSACNDAITAKQLLKAGAVGFLSKNSPVFEMLAAIEQVMSGKHYLCDEIAQKIALLSLDGSESPFAKLSRREHSVAGLILQGKSIAEMKTILALSDKTVNTYRYRLYEKLNVKNDVELAHLARMFDYQQD